MDARTLQDVPLKYHAALQRYRDLGTPTCPEDVVHGVGIAGDLIEAAVAYIDELEEALDA